MSRHHCDILREFQNLYFAKLQKDNPDKHVSHSNKKMCMQPHKYKVVQI